MEYVYNFFAVIFGYIMNGFFYVLDLIGMPYFWLCIVLFALVSRLMFLPQKIRSLRKKVLEPAISYDKKLVRKKYGSVTKKDKAKYKQYKKDIDAVYKKYNAYTGNGFLVFLVQLPIFVGLFRVVKQPLRYVPLMSALSESEKATFNDFFGLSLESLPQAFGALGILVPAAVLLCSIWRIVPLLRKGNICNNIVFIFINSLQGFLLTFMSFCFPIAISLYWIVTNITNHMITYIVRKKLKNNSKIQDILKRTEFYISEEKSHENALKAQTGENTKSSTVNIVS